MFLYYFDNELAESPRGVIDLELYTEVFREDGLLRLGTVDEEILRLIFFNNSNCLIFILLVIDHFSSMMTIRTT